jgi:hypothetical protein
MLKKSELSAAERTQVVLWLLSKEETRNLGVDRQVSTLTKPGQTIPIDFGAKTQMLQRWIASSLKEVSRGFRTVLGYRDMRCLVSALAKAVPATSDGKFKIA